MFFCVGSGLCEGLITCTEESYQICVCGTVCVLETSTLRRSGPEKGRCATVAGMGGRGRGGEQKKRRSNSISLYKLQDFTFINFFLLTNQTH